MKSPEPTDDELLARLQARDGTVLAALLDRHGPRLTALIGATWRGIAASDAEEILADVLADAWYRVGEIDPGRGSLTSWLLMRARYRTLDRLRVARRERDLLTRLRAIVRPLVGRPEYASNLDAHLAGLDPLEQRLVWLRFVEGRPLPEVARACGLTPKAAEHRLDRLRERLRRSLTDPPPEGVPNDV